jgi:hypothetical protein
MLLSPLYFMVREMTKKHLAAINRGRKAAGLKPIRMKKKFAKSIKDLKNGKPLNPKSQKKVNRAMADLRKKGLVK